MRLRGIVVEGWTGLTILSGLVCGLAAVYVQVGPAFALVGVLALLVGLYVPTISIAFVFAGIALDTTGLVGFEFAGLPMTLSKLSSVYAMGCYLVNSVMRGRPLVRLNYVLMGQIAIITTMVASVGVSGRPDMAYRFIAGVAMLTVLTMVIERAADPEQMNYLMRFMAVQIIGLTIWNLMSGQDYVVFVSDQAWQERSSGAFADPNFWAAFLVVTCPLVIASLVADEDSVVARVLLVAVCILYPLSVVQSYSRAGMLGMALTVPGLAYLLRRHMQYLGLAVVVAIPLLPFVINLDALALRYSTLLDPTVEADLGYASLSERTELLRAGVQLIREHTITGIGVGMFSTYASYVTAGGVWKVAHNTYVTVWAEQGILGVFSHAFAFGAVAWSGYRAAFKAPTYYLRTVAKGWLLGMAGVALMALTLNMMDFAVIYYCIGVGLVVESTTHRAPDAVGVRLGAEVRV